MTQPDRDRKKREFRSYVSFVFSAVSLSSLAGLAWLLELSHRAPSTRLEHSILFFKVALPIAIAGIAAATAVLVSIPIFISGNVKPLLWLVPTCGTIAIFVGAFGWWRLFYNGMGPLPWRMTWLNFFWHQFGYLGMCVGVLTIIAATTLMMKFRAPQN